MLRNFIQLSKKFPLGAVRNQLKKIKRVAISRRIDKKSLFLLNIGVFYDRSFTENFDVDLHRACENGEDSILNFMETLRNDIEMISDKYLEALCKQIEIVEANMDVDPLSHHWDDLIEYRNITNELNEDFNRFVTICKTLRHMLDNGSLQLITPGEECFDIIGDKIRELDTFVDQQIIKIKERERHLLDCHKQEILQTV